MRRTGFILTILAAGSLLVVSAMTEQLLAQATREKVITEEKTTTTTTTVSPVTITKEITVQEAPPAPREEVRMAPPGPGTVWVPGVWTWNNAWQWVPGRFEQPPPRMTAWVPGQWVQQGNTYVYRPGHWQQQ
jgi:hypothetical protein